MLDLIKRALDKNNIASCRIEGSMNRVQRSDTIDRFQNDPHLTVILV
jgi:SNF2 family DNA or RNA helicase